MKPQTCFLKRFVLMILLLPALHKAVGQADSGHAGNLYQKIPIAISTVKIAMEEGEQISSHKKVDDPIIAELNDEDINKDVHFYNRSFRSINSFTSKNLQFQFEKYLSGLDFPVEGWSNSLFPELHEPQEPVLKLGIVVKDLKIFFKKYGTNPPRFTYLAVIPYIQFQVFDPTKGNIIYKKNIFGLYKTEEERRASNVINKYVIMENADFHFAIVNALQDATDKFLHDNKMQETFRAIAEKDAIASKNYDDQEAIALVDYSTQSSPQATVRHVRNSTVTIKSGSRHGSGFFVSENLILTCEHTVTHANSNNIRIYLNENLSIKGRLIRANREYDVALLKVNQAQASPVPLAANDSGRVSSNAYALGSPVKTDLMQTVTKGIISGHPRLKEKHYIQTDASISPGNSGGPLLNKNGEVIGIINKKVATDKAEGLGFAIPLHVAMDKLNLGIKQ